MINKKILVIDRGLFVEYALKLADYFEQVYYYVSWENSYPRIHESLIGSEWRNGKKLDTFDGKPFTRVENIWEYVDEVDYVMFLDIYDAPLQRFLQDYGVKVIGNKEAENLELERAETKKRFKEIGMDTVKNIRIIGVDNLREYLKHNTNKFVKISKFRQTFETFHHTDYQLTRSKLDKIAKDLGAIGDIVEFVIEDEIPNAVEEGVDTYNVRGQYPDKMWQGIELKDLLYWQSWVDYGDLSPGNTEVLEKFSRLLREGDSTGMFSTEVRTVGDKHYFIDPCMRLGMPTNAVQQEMYENLGEIVVGLGEGTLVNPIMKAKYGLEVLMSSDWLNYTTVQPILFDKKYRDNIKLTNMVKIDGYYYVMNLAASTTVGSIVAYGDTMEECKKQVLKIAKTIVADGITISTDPIDEGAEEFQKMLSFKK